MLEQVYESLCLYDQRNPFCFDAYDAFDERIRPRLPSCYCNNCFHGKDALALEILRLRALLESTRA